MYIGNNLQVANPSYKIIDDISSGFNGSTTSFALQVSGATPVPFPISTQQVMISVNGVVQEPDPSGSAGFKLLGSNIVFSSAPANGHAFFGTILAGSDYVTAGSEFPDGSVTAPSFTFEADQDSGWYRIGSGSVGYSANGVQILDFDGNGLNLPDNKKVQLGTSSDLQLYHNGSHSYLDHTGTGDLWLRSTPSGGDIYGITADNGCFVIQNASNAVQFISCSTGSTDLYHNGTKKLETSSSGISVAGDVSAEALTATNGNAINLADSKKINLGTSSDFQLYHDGGDSFIKDTGTGGIRIDTNQLLCRNAAGDEYTIHASENGAVELYYNHVKTFETDPSGIKVTGPEGDAAHIYMFADEGDDTADKWAILASAGGTFQIRNRESGSWVDKFIITGSGRIGTENGTTPLCGDGGIDIWSIGNTNRGALTIGADATADATTRSANTEKQYRIMMPSYADPANMVAQIFAASDSSANAINYGGGTGWAYAATLHRFYTAANTTTATGTLALTIDSSQNATFGGNIRVNDSKQVQLGTGSDTYMWHDGSNGYFRNTTGSFYFQSKSTENAIRIVPDGEVALFYNDGERFRTLDTGARFLSAEGGVCDIEMMADEGDDNADKWRFQIDTSGNFKIDNYSTGSWVNGLTVNGSNNATFAGTVSDSKGDLRKIINNYQTGAYTAVAADAGKCILITTGGVTINTSVFSASDAVTIINDSGSNQTITQGSGLTIYNTADATTGNRTLAGRGMATLWFAADNKAYISGAGLS